MLNAAAGHDSNMGPKSQLLLVDEESNVEPGALPPEDPRLLPALTDLIGYHVLRGDFRSAAPLLSRALSIGEGNAGADQSDLAILLNDLARICLKASAHALAEPLLTRLLAIKQSKGENHPEVATVLASLALVREGLGQHESAEQLWRRVLEIRERTLAPNHFSVASALEHLAESCAARGNIDEALQHYQRAQTIRQLTLGNNHPSVRISRDRIADLQLQASEASSGISPTPSAPVSPPDGLRPRFPAEKRSMSPILFVPPTPEPPGISATTREIGPGEIGPASYDDVLRSIARELGDEDTVDAAESYLDSGNLARASGFLREHKRNLAIAGAATVAILVGAWAWDTNADGRALGVTADLQPPAAFAASPAVPSASRLAANDSQTSTASRRTALPASIRKPVSQVFEAPKRGADRRETNSVTIPELSARTMLNVDSAVRAAGAGTKNLVESLTPDVGAPPLTSSQRSNSYSGEPLSVTRPHRAILIGSLPAPTLPNYSSGAEGEVLVSFTVDTEGRPVMSTFSVVRSPDLMLSSAVRKVIPSLRFEPAQTGGPDPKRVVDTVQVVYRFAQHLKQ